MSYQYIIVYLQLFHGHKKKLWSNSTISTYPNTNLISNIIGTIISYFNNNISICLKGDVVTNCVQFAMNTFAHKDIPTITPAKSPSFNPSITPTNIRTITPSISPTILTSKPSNIPAITPSNYPTISPTIANAPSIAPTITTTNNPTNSPTSY